MEFEENVSHVASQGKCAESEIRLEFKSRRSGLEKKIREAMGQKYIAAKLEALKMETMKKGTRLLAPCSR